jgi:FKBP-type peptidyl-prolyl cis-trans isomerase
MSELAELKITDTTVGTGREASKGAKVTVHYEGFLEDGKKFDSSVDRGRPFSFVLGAGKVIQGWDRGVMGMKEGGKRTLHIPASLAYGPRAVGPIPPNSNLIFHIELIESLPRE